MNTITDEALDKIPLDEEENNVTHFLEVRPNPKNNKRVDYSFYYHDNIIHTYTGEYPSSLKPQTSISREIKKYIDQDGRFSKKVVNTKYEKVIQIAGWQIDMQLNLLEREKLEEEAKNQQVELEGRQRATKVLEQTDDIIIWIASHIDWLTAGERNNILLSFLTYSCQVILKEPISVIYIGEGGSGKSHVQKVSESLIPEEYIIPEKNITEAAMFNRSKQDPYFYDGKIVDYGDVGGFNEQEFIAESKNRIKELQSEGKLTRPTNVQSPDGSWEVQEVVLYGKPCLTYTTVPGYKFDDQEISRSIFITPRMDNKDIFNRRLIGMEFAYGTSDTLYQEYKAEAELIPYMVRVIKDYLEDVTIVNPYIFIVIEFLEGSMYYKRDFNKYNSLLKTVCAFNCFHREIHTLPNGEQVMYCTMEDVQIFLSLLEHYRESINLNLSPKSVEVIRELRELVQKDSFNYYYIEALDEHTQSFTIKDFNEKSELGLSLRSLYRYFKELEEARLIVQLDRKSKGNVYALPDEDDIKETSDLAMEEEMLNIILEEVGVDVVTMVKNDTKREDLSIFNQDPHVVKPAWQDYDKTNEFCQTTDKTNGKTKKDEDASKTETDGWEVVNV